MNTVGRLMQVLGLVILPVAMILEISGMLGRNGVAELLIMLIFGTCLFYAGRLLEGYAK